MTKEELLKKVEDDKITKEDVLEYFQVKNIDGLSFALEEMTKDLNVNLDYINTSFSFIYAAKEKEMYNPVEEKFYYYSMILAGLYSIDTKLVNAIARGIGVFQTIMILDKSFSQREEVKYYENLYNDYVAQRQSLAIILSEISKDLLEFLEAKVSNLKLEDLQTLGKKILEEANKLVKDKVN
jgi:hypothetical protein